MSQPLAESTFVHTYPRLRVTFGRGTAFALAPILEQLGVERALLVTGAHVGANEALVGGIRAGSGGRIAAWFGRVGPHAPIPDVDAAVDEYRANDCDGVVSLGGGSCHDAARAIGLCLATGKRLKEHFPTEGRAFVHYGDRRLARPPLVAVPSTLSAAETTFGGGVVDPADEKKYVFVGFDLFMSHVVVDPDVFATTPLEILLSTGMNAMNHAVERLCSPKLQPIVTPMLTGALRLLIPWLPVLARDGVGYVEALAHVALGAHISESTEVPSGIGHAIAHQLGGRYRLGHGTLNGIVMPACLEFVEPVRPDAVRSLQASLADLAGGGEELWLPDFLRDFVRSLGLPVRLREVGVPADELPLVAEAVLDDFSTPSSARPITGADDVLGVLRRCW
jgi:alcohol dehydrogenase class IV